MDIRETASNERWWTSTYNGVAQSNVASIFEGREIPITLEVCHICDGEGSYVNPSVDSHGLSEDDFADAGPDFRQDYFSGVYDIPCALCRGANVIPVPTDEDDLSELDAEANDFYEYQLEVEAERRYFGSY